MITAGHRNHGRTWKVLDTDLKSLGLGGAAGLGAGAALCGSCCGVDTYSSVQKVQGSPGEKSRLRRHSAHKNAERSTLLRSRAVWESGRTCKCLRGHDTPASLSDAPVDWPAEQAWPRYTLAGCAATAGAGDRPRVAESPSRSFAPSRGMAAPRLGDIWPTLTLAGCATTRGGGQGCDWRCRRRVKDLRTPKALWKTRHLAHPSRQLLPREVASRELWSRFLPSSPSSPS